METSELITVHEAARRLEVCTRTVTRGVDAGLLRAKYGGLQKNRIVGIYAEDVETLRRKTSHETTGGNV